MEHTMLLIRLLISRVKGGSTLLPFPQDTDFQIVTGHPESGSCAGMVVLLKQHPLPQSFWDWKQISLISFVSTAKSLCQESGCRKTIQKCSLACISFSWTEPHASLNRCSYGQNCFSSQKKAVKRRKVNLLSIYLLPYYFLLINV